MPAGACPGPQPSATRARLLPCHLRRAGCWQVGGGGRCTALGRAPSLAAPSQADGSRHMHFLTRSIGWERAELSPQVCDQSQTCPGRPGEGGPACHPSITQPIYGTFIPAEQVGDLAASQVAGVLPLHPWGYWDGQCPPAWRGTAVPELSI